MSSIVVLGAGINGLVAANLLAARGFTVTLVDSGSGVGGEARYDQLASGYTAPGILDRTERFSPQVARALQLGDLPREASKTVFSADTNGDGLYVPDGARAPSGGLSDTEEVAWRQYVATHQRLMHLLRPLMESDPPSPLGGESIGLRWFAKLAREYVRLNRGDRELLLRGPPAPLGDWLTEHFTSKRLQASLAWSGLEGVSAAPASPGTAAIRILHDASDHGPLVGGVRRLIEVLEGGCQSRGVTIRLGATPQVVVSNGGVVAVELDGEPLKASAVLSTIDPVSTLLHRVKGAELAPAFERALRNVRQRGTTVRYDFALDREFLLRGGQRPSRIRIGDSLQYIERAFDASKYDALPDNPWLEIRVPSAATDERDLAPPGCDIVSVLVRYITPAAILSEEQCSALRLRVIRQLETLCAGFEGSIIAERFQGHHELQSQYGFPNGNLSYVEPGLDQLFSMRPLAECGRFHTPIAGLWLGSMGCHPAGGMTGLAGWLSARALSAALNS